MIIQDKLWKIKRLLFEVNLLNVSPLNSAGEANTEVKAAMMQNKRTQTRVTLIVVKCRVWGCQLWGHVYTLNPGACQDSLYYNLISAVAWDSDADGDSYYEFTILFL